MLRVERTGPSGAVARVTLDPPRGPQRVQRLADRRAADDVRRPRARVADGAPRRRPRRRRPVVLRRRRHRLDARRDGPRRRGQRAGRDGDGRDVRGDRHVPGARSIARVQGAALGGGMGLCAVRDLVIAEAGREVRVHRDAPRHPAGGDLAVRHRQDRRVARPGAVPGRPAVRRDPGAADRARPRGRRGRRRRSTRPWTAPSPTCSRPARPRRAPRRRSSARCAGWATGRRSGTPRG